MNREMAKVLAPYLNLERGFFVFLTTHPIAMAHRAVGEGRLLDLDDGLVLRELPRLGVVPVADDALRRDGLDVVLAPRVLLRDGLREERTETSRVIDSFHFSTTDAAQRLTLAAARRILCGRRPKRGRGQRER